MYEPETSSVYWFLDHRNQRLAEFRHGPEPKGEQDDKIRVVEGESTGIIVPVSDVFSNKEKAMRMAKLLGYRI
jgi:hypothetical protein